MNSSKEELKTKLYSILNEDEFVLGILSAARNQDGYDYINDFINENPNSQPNEILFAIMLFDQKRHPECYADIANVANKED